MKATFTFISCLIARDSRARQVSDRGINPPCNRVEIHGRKGWGGRGGGGLVVIPPVLPSTPFAGHLMAIH